MNETIKIIKDVLQHQTVQLVMGVIMAIGALVSLYSTSREAPILADLLNLHSQVNAEEARLTAVEGYIPQVIKMGQQVTDIQTEQIRQGTKLDGIDGFLRGYK